MLFVSCFFSVCFLVIAVLVACRGKYPIVTIISIAIGFFVFTIWWGGLLPAFTLQMILIPIAMEIGKWRKWRPRTFVRVFFWITVALHGMFGWFAYRHVSELLGNYPCVSLENRFSIPRAEFRAATLHTDAQKTLSSMEQGIDSGGYGHWHPRRYRLEKLHEETVQTFVNQPGFGIRRIMLPSEETLQYGLRTDPPLPQPGKPAPSLLSTGALDKLASPDNRKEGNDELSNMHKEGVLDFVHPTGFGFIKDRSNVAGFQEHQFSKTPESVPPWKLQTLDLLGLVVHDKPVVYISANLPRMDELREAPTRSLDDFEALGLKSLSRGEDLFVRSNASDMRLLGAIRSAKQCIACHGGQRGDLLGAFSYTFTRQDNWRSFPGRH